MRGRNSRKEEQEEDQELSLWFETGDGRRGTDGVKKSADEDMTTATQGTKRIAAVAWSFKVCLFVNDCQSQSAQN